MASGNHIKFASSETTETSSSLQSNKSSLRRHKALSTRLEKDYENDKVANPRDNDSTSESSKIQRLVQKIQELKGNISQLEAARRQRSTKEVFTQTPNTVVTDVWSARIVLGHCVRDIEKLRTLLRSENALYKLKSKSIEKSCCDENVPHTHGLLDGLIGITLKWPEQSEMLDSNGVKEDNGGKKMEKIEESKSSTGNKGQQSAKMSVNNGEQPAVKSDENDPVVLEMSNENNAQQSFKSVVNDLALAVEPEADEAEQAVKLDVNDRTFSKEYEGNNDENDPMMTVAFEPSIVERPIKLDEDEIALSEEFNENHAKRSIKLDDNANERMDELETNVIENTKDQRDTSKIAQQTKSVESSKGLNHTTYNMIARSRSVIKRSKKKMCLPCPKSK